MSNGRGEGKPRLVSLFVAHLDFPVEYFVAGSATNIANVGLLLDVS